MVSKQRGQLTMDFSNYIESCPIPKERTLQKSSPSIYRLDRQDNKKRKRLLSYIINHEKSF